MIARGARDGLRRQGHESKRDAGAGDFAPLVAATPMNPARLSLTVNGAGPFVTVLTSRAASALAGN